MKKVTLSDAVLVNLAKQQPMRVRVPALQVIYNALTQRKGRCSTCARRAKVSQAMISVRAKLANNPASLIALKQVLKADKLIIYARGPKGLTQRREV